MSNDKELAIVFADVVGSTQLYESLGNDVAREIVHRCVALMKEATLEFGGKAIFAFGRCTGKIPYGSATPLHHTGWYRME